MHGLGLAFKLHRILAIVPFSTAELNNLHRLRGDASKQFHSGRR